MSATGITLGLSLASALFAAMSNTAARYLMLRTRTRDYLVLNFVIIFVMLVPFSPWAFRLSASPTGLALLLLACFIDAWANYFYFRSFEVNDAGTASVLLSLSPVFTLALIPVFGIGAMEMNAAMLTGIGLVITGALALNANIARIQGFSMSWRLNARWGLPVMAALLFGVNVYLIKHLFTENIVNPYSYYLVRALVIAAFMWVVLRPRHQWVTRRLFGATAVRGVFVIAQWLLMLWALDIGNPPIVKSVSETTPLFVILMSAGFLRERASLLTVIGAIMVVVGLFVIGVR